MQQSEIMSQLSLDQQQLYTVLNILKSMFTAKGYELKVSQSRRKGADQSQQHRQFFQDRVIYMNRKILNQMQAIYNTQGVQFLRKEVDQYVKEQERHCTELLARDKDYQMIRMESELHNRDSSRESQALDLARTSGNQLTQIKGSAPFN